MAVPTRELRKSWDLSRARLFLFPSADFSRLPPPLLPRLSLSLLSFSLPFSFSSQRERARACTRDYGHVLHGRQRRWRELVGQSGGRGVDTKG